MLRRKLLLVLGSVVTLLLASGLTAILMLQSVLHDLDRAVAKSAAATLTITDTHARLAVVENTLHLVQSGSSSVDMTALDMAATAIMRHVQALRELDASRTESADAAGELVAIERVSTLAAQLQHQIRSRRVQDETASALATVSALREALAAFDVDMHLYTDSQQASAAAKFRWTAIWLGLTFVVVINVSIMVFSRTASMILKPVDRLLEASRRLAREEFHHRIELDRRDEFGELAEAYNRLAAQLQANEQRKLETLHQVARTLSHELNNAISIVQSQLDVLARMPGHGSTGGLSDRFGARLHEIRQAMARMSAIVGDLTRVQRIVLTDYLSGVKMLDLERSLQDGPTNGSGESAEPRPLERTVT